MLRARTLHSHRIISEFQNTELGNFLSFKELLQIFVRFETIEIVLAIGLNERQQREGMEICQI